MTNTGKTGNMPMSSRLKGSASNSKAVVSVAAVVLTGRRKAVFPAWGVTGSSRTSSNPCSVPVVAEGVLPDSGDRTITRNYTCHFKMRHIPTSRY